MALVSYANPTVNSMNSCWEPWNQSYSYSTTLTTTGTWQNWNLNYSTSSTTTIYFVPQWQNWNTAYEETAEEHAARETACAERRRQDDERYAAYRQTLVAATSRAEELLASMLTDEQLGTYRAHGWFEVRGSAGGRWRIRNRGQAGNVDLMPETGNERDMSFCCHPPDGLPPADAHLAQMLHLVTDEDGFKRTANVAWRRPALLAERAA